MNLAALIRATKGDRSYEDLARLSKGQPGAKRWQQLATQPQKNFPDPPTIRGMARALGVEEVRVIIASAATLGLEVTTAQESHLVSLLPPGLGRLTNVQVTAIRSVVLAMLNPGEGVSVDEELYEEAGAPPLVVAFDPHRPSDYSRDAYVAEQQAAARQAPSEGRRLRRQQDEEGETP